LFDSAHTEAKSVSLEG